MAGGELAEISGETLVIHGPFPINKTYEGDSIPQLEYSRSPPYWGRHSEGMIEKDEGLSTVSHKSGRSEAGED